MQTSFPPPPDKFPLFILSRNSLTVHFFFLVKLLEKLKKRTEYRSSTWLPSMGMGDLCKEEWLLMVQYWEVYSCCEVTITKEIDTRMQEGKRWILRRKMTVLWEFSWLRRNMFIQCEMLKQLHSLLSLNARSVLWCYAKTWTVPWKYTVYWACNGVCTTRE